MYLMQEIGQPTRVVKTEFAQSIQKQMARTLFNTRLKRQRLRLYFRQYIALPA